MSGEIIPENSILKNKIPFYLPNAPYGGEDHLLRKLHDFIMLKNEK